MGIKFAFTNSDSTNWVGRSSGPGIGQGVLSAPERVTKSLLLVGLDRFKVVSLGLGQLSDHQGPSLKSPSQNIIDSPRERPRLWTPYPPRHEGLKISTLSPSLPTRPFELLTNIDFGGPRGVLLGSLERLVVHIAPSPRLLIGVNIFYSDGKSISFGSSDGFEISFFINGSKGERIDQIRILEQTKKFSTATKLNGLQVFLYVFLIHLRAMLTMF